MQKRVGKLNSREMQTGCASCNGTAFIYRSRLEENLKYVQVNAGIRQAKNSQMRLSWRSSRNLNDNKLMKKIISLFIVAAAILTGCNNSQSNSNSTPTNESPNVSASGNNTNDPVTTNTSSTMTNMPPP